MRHHQEYNFDLEEGYSRISKLEEKLEVFHELYANCINGMCKRMIEKTILELSQEYQELTGDYYRRTVRRKN